MDIDSLAKKYLALSQIERIHVLARLSWHMTVLARCFYEDRDCTELSRVRVIAINEFQHRILSMISDDINGKQVRSGRELVEYLATGLQEFGAIHLLAEVL